MTEEKKSPAPKKDEESKKSEGKNILAIILFLVALIITLPPFIG